MIENIQKLRELHDIRGDIEKKVRLGAWIIAELWNRPYKVQECMRQCEDYE